MRVLDLCAGIGGFSLAAHWLGWSTAAFCERDKFCQKVLAKNFPEVEIYDDVYEFPSKSFRGRADIITAGFPCQPFSQAGKREGRNDERHLFPAILEIVRDVRPLWCVFENVRGLLSIESGQVFAEITASLESIGYEVITFCVPASAVNAPHRRDRLWIIAHSIESRAGRDNGTLANKSGRTRESGRTGIRQGNGTVGTGRTDSADPNATNPDNTGDRASASEPHAKRPPLGGERGEPQFESSGHADDAITDTRCKYGQSGRNGGMATSASEWSHGIVDPQRCRERDADTTDACAFGVPRNSKGAGQPGGINRSGQNEYGRTGARIPQFGENWPAVAARFCRMDDGLPDELHESGSRDNRVNRLKALGNSIVPQLAYEIFRAIDQTK